MTDEAKRMWREAVIGYITLKTFTDPDDEDRASLQNSGF
jgi:hypothetical protein